MIDAWRLAVGMLTIVRIKPPRTVDRRVAGLTMLVAPFAVIPLALAVVVIGALGREVGIPPLVLGFMSIGALSLGNRAFHLDGLADVADALTASYDQKRSLEVMHDSVAGPAAIAMLVVTLGVQASSFGALFTLDRGPWIAGLLVCTSRAILALTCATGVPPAPTPGLAVTYFGTVTRLWSVVTWLVVLAVLTVSLHWAGSWWWHGAIVVLVALATVAFMLRRSLRRFGGVTGDVFGATIELTLATTLVAATLS